MFSSLLKSYVKIVAMILIELTIHMWKKNFACAIPLDEKATYIFHLFLTSLSFRQIIKKLLKIKLHL